MKNMKRFLLLMLAAASWLSSAARTEKPVWSFDIKEVDIKGRRPMKEIGVQQTRLDSTVLKENVALSMADVLTFNSTIFIKQYGRATLSTASFRGTSPSHTQVTWNGMRINSPMLGMTDFSMIPSYFIDDASLLHGTSSVNQVGGGLGGAVVLATKPAETQGIKLQYIQGIGSFRTFDEFLRLTYGNDRWQGSTRVVYSSSVNDFKFLNRDKKENIYDADKNIVAQYHPKERNRNGAFNDLHMLQELYYNTGTGNRFGLSAWFVDSDRGIPTIDASYGDDDYVNKQREQTLRSVLSWDMTRSNFKLGAKAGYIHTWLAYDYRRDLGNGVMASMVDARSNVDTAYGQAEAEYYIGKKWMFSANIALHQHFVESQDRNVLKQNGEWAEVGYDKARLELSGYVSAKWQPTERLGLSLALREEVYGGNVSPVIPAGFVDYLLSKRGKVLLKASMSRNYRFPTLNDLYFLPGGNPDLKREHGFTYDAGVSFTVGETDRFSLHGEAAWFDSRIDDWIIWLPDFKGYWTPKNIKRVHAYGVELKAALAWNPGEGWHIGTDGNFAWTPSVNHGDKVSPGDRSVGKQLCYIPKYSAAAAVRVAYKSWRLIYKWSYYDERYTMSSNARTITGYLPPNYMNNVSLEKLFGFSFMDFSVKGQVNNLFDEEYKSVLARPMPGINFEVFLEIKPQWGKHKK